MRGVLGRQDRVDLGFSSLELFGEEEYDDNELFADDEPDQDEP